MKLLLFRSLLIVHFFAFNINWNKSWWCDQGWKEEKTLNRRRKRRLWIQEEKEDFESKKTKWVNKEKRGMNVQETEREKKNVLLHLPSLGTHSMLLTLFLEEEFTQSEETTRWNAGTSLSKQNTNSYTRSLVRVSKQTLPSQWMEEASFWNHDESRNDESRKLEEKREKGFQGRVNIWLAS